MAPNACSHQKFPEELKPLCKEPNAQEILQRLGEPPLPGGWGRGTPWLVALERGCALIGGSDAAVVISSKL